MTTIKKNQMKMLMEKGILKNTHKGIVNQEGMPVGFRKTANKCYIEDSYAVKARELSN